MSDTSGSARYQNALTYNPSRSVGTYLDGRAQGGDYGFEPVASRAPRVYDPYISGPVAQWAPLDFASFGGTTTSGGVADMSAVSDGPNLLGLVARYGPQVLKAIDKAQGLFGDSPEGFDNRVPYAAPLPGAEGAIDSFQNGVGAFGDSFVSGQGGVAADFFKDGANATADSFANTAASYGGADAAAAGGAEAAAGGAGDAAAGALGGFDYSSLATGAMGAVAGAAGSYAGNYIGQSINDGRIDSTENGQIGATAGGILGGVVGTMAGGPVGTAMGAFAGSYFGGLIGSQIGRETDMPSVYAQGFFGPDGNFASSGVMRHGGGSYDTANALSQIAPNYFSQRAAADGLAPNTGMAGMGYFFGGGTHDGEGGWFMQQNEQGAGEVRPDLNPLYAGANANIGYGEGGDAYTDPAYQAAARLQGVTGIDVHRASTFDEALNAGYDRLRGWGYFVDPSTNPSSDAAWARYNGKYGDPNKSFDPNVIPTPAGAIISDGISYGATNPGYDGGTTWGTNYGSNPTDGYNIDQGIGG